MVAAWCYKLFTSIMSCSDLNLVIFEFVRIWFPGLSCTHKLMRVLHSCQCMQDNAVISVSYLSMQRGHMTAWCFTFVCVSLMTHGFCLFALVSGYLIDVAVRGFAWMSACWPLIVVGSSLVAAATIYFKLQVLDWFCDFLCWDNYNCGRWWCTFVYKSAINCCFCKCMLLLSVAVLS